MRDRDLNVSTNRVVNECGGVERRDLAESGEILCHASSRQACK
jgi:hypothetical protein